MKKFRSIPGIILLFAGFVTLLVSSIPNWIGLILLASSAILLLIANRGIFTFAKGNKIITQKKTPDFLAKAMPYYEKAVKLGLPDQYTIVAGTLLLQHGNIDVGKQALEDLKDTKDKKIKYQTYESLSMYYWIKGDVDKAIKVCLEAKNMGYKDKNLFINLGAYYLAKNNTHEFKLILKECQKSNMMSTAMMDLQAACLILQGEYDKAGNTLHTIFEALTPNYIDPYIHFFMVYLHYGEFNAAIKCLNDALENSYFANTSVFKKEEVEKMIKIVENPKTKWSFLRDIEEHPEKLANGEMPTFVEEENPSIPKLPTLPEFKSTIAKKEEQNEKDDDEPDTSLTDEDEEWLRKHNM